MKLKHMITKDDTLKKMYNTEKTLKMNNIWQYK